MSLEKRCPQCRAVLAAGAPEGLCPKCLMQLALRPECAVAAETPTVTDEQPGTVIGPYKLLERIGEGGMATVYMAEQERPLRRRVALKITKLGMDTKQVVARFAVERQALAMMDHPNIARVFAAGATEAGRPYFVMELVRGISITEYCNRNKLSTRKRLDLFVTVCNAVQHAHQKGIIHRDLKPSNTMITLHDGVPVPKVIDFGIAKAMDQRLTDETVFTRYAEMIGTPEYMSPEQAEMSGLDIDTRTDIYSLGVVLYELLTGALPFDTQTLRAASLTELQRIIREEEPMRPSTRLSALGDEAQRIASNRHTNVLALTKCLRGDLDWIVLKCLEKDRTRRYDSAGALGADVLHYLNNEPILAIPPRLAYQVQKFLHRHRQQVALFSAVLVACVAFFSVLGLWNHKRVQFRETENVRHQASLIQAKESLAQQDWVTALKAIQSLEDSPHVGPEAQLLYGNTLMQSGHVQAAIETLNDLAQGEPMIAGTAHALLARIHWEHPDIHDANTLATVHYHRSQAEAALTDEPEALYLRALTTPTVKAQLRFLNQALEQDPSHYESRKLRTMIHYASRDYRAMHDDALGITIAKPKEATGYLMRGIALKKQNKFSQAMPQFDRALALMDPHDPQRSKLLERRCETRLYLGSHDQALAAARFAQQAYPEQARFDFYALCAYTAQGRYGKAVQAYHAMHDAKKDKLEYVIDWCRRHVVEMYEAGQPWHPPGDLPEEPPFIWMQITEEHYLEHASKGERIIPDGYNPAWSPNGSKLAFGAGFHGYSGVAVYDVNAKSTELLVVPGSNPEWSPDGRSLLFLRSRQVLPLSQFTSAERQVQGVPDREQELWIMNSDGTESRRLVQHAGWAYWGPDSQAIFYSHRLTGTLHRLSLQEPNAIPQAILQVPTYWPSVSPDGKYVAHCDQPVDILRIYNMTSPHKEIASWANDTRAFTGHWSPDSRQLVMGGRHSVKGRFMGYGLWSFDVQTQQATKWLNGQITTGHLSPDQTYLCFATGSPFFDIWLIPTATLQGSPTVAEHHKKIIADLTRLVEHYPRRMDYALLLVRAWGFACDDPMFRKNVESLLDRCDPDQLSELRLGIAEMMVRQDFPGHPEMVIEQAQQAIDMGMSPDTRWRAMALMARAHYHKKDWHKTIQVLTENLNSPQAGAFDYFLMAMAHWDLKEREKAHSIYGKGIRALDENSNRVWGPYFRFKAKRLMGID